MKILLTKILCGVFVILVGLFAAAEKNFAWSPKSVDVKKLERDFVAEFSRDFKFVKSETKENLVENQKLNYWLAHVKPQRTGFFTIKYAYQFADKFYASGETEMKIAVGGKECSRYPQVVRETGYFCLGDTIIIPVRLTNFSKHTFYLKSKEETAENVEKNRMIYNNSNGLNTEKVINPIEGNIKYLGKHRIDNLYRNGGGIFTHIAVFEAVRKGRFNLSLSGIYEKNKTLDEYASIPIIIINRGESITSLIPEERITFIKDRSYSSAYKNSFESNLRILQPGEIFSVAYAAFHAKAWWQEKNGINESEVRALNVIPVIKSEPFSIKKEDGFNSWVADFSANSGK